MRSLLLTVFVSLALARDKEGYHHDMHYTYRYEAQLATGAPQSSKLWSTLRLTANFHLYFVTTGNRVTAMLTDVNLQRMDKFVEDRTPSFFLHPEEKMLDGIEVDIKTVMIQQLQQPFSCVYDNGHVKDLRFGESDPIWSTNIKRGVIGVFEVNLDHQYSTSPIPNKGKEVDPLLPSYTVWESSTFGYCKTVYTPKPCDQPQSFYLTKVRDYKSCAKEKSSMVLSFDNFRSEDKQNDTKPLDLQGEVTYAIKGSKDNFLILTAIGESKTIFTPYSPQDGNVQTCINQTLYLHNAKPIGNSLSMHLDPAHSESSTLEMVLPSRCVEDRQPYVLQEFTKCQTQNLWSISKMEQLLTYVANATDTYPSKDVVPVMQRLMEMIRQCNQQTLAQLLKKVWSDQEVRANSVHQLKWKVLWELLSTAGTTEATKVLLDRCLKDFDERSWSPHKQCINAVTSISLFTPPSETIITKLITLVKKADRASHGPRKQSAKEMKMVAVLCLGSVMGRAEDLKQEIIRTSQRQIQAMDEIIDVDTAGERVSELQQTKEKLQNRISMISSKHHQIVVQFTELIEHLLLNTHLDFDNILAMKTLRNAHVPASIKLIQKCLSNQLGDPAVRIAAAQAYEKFCEGKAHKMVLSNLEEVLKNPVELTSVRIQCFRSLVNVRAPVETLIRLASSIRYEEEKQLSTYVWSVFSEIANCSFRPYRRAAAQFRTAMAFIEPVKVGVEDSHYRNWCYKPADNWNGLVEGSYISTPNFVTSVDATSYWNMFGSTNKAVQISWLSDGLEKLVKKMAGPKGFFTNRNSLFDLLQRTKRGINTRDMIKDIFEKLSVTARQLPKAKGFVNLQVMNSVVRSFDLSTVMQKMVDLDIVQADIDEARMKAGLEFTYKTSGVLGQFYMDLPSEAGFPVNLQMGVSYSAKASGAVNAAVERSVYKQEREMQPARKLKAGLYIKPQAVACVMGKMSVDGYLYQAGSLFHSLAEFRGPFSINASVDLKHNHLSVKFSPPVSADEPIMKWEMEPYVFSLAMANNITRQQKPVNRRPLFITMQPVMISDGARIQEVQKEMGKYSLGYSVWVQGQYPWRSQPWATACPLLGRADFAVYIKPGHHQPPCLRADFRYFSVSSYRDPDAPREIPCDSWRTLFGLMCVGTDEAEGVVKTTPRPSLQTMPVSYPDFPDLSTHINFASVKQKIESRFGQSTPPSGSEWSFIATFNSSTEHLIRGATVECMVQSWKEGQYQQSFWTISRTGIPNYDPMPWKMNIKATAFYPPKRYWVRDLLDPKHQIEAITEMNQMMQKREHKVTNKYFQELLFTKLYDYEVQRLPSMDPQIILDRMAPELVLESTDSSAIKILSILKQLMPVSDQMVNLKEELKDAFKITTKQGLLLELSTKIASTEDNIMRLLQDIGEKPTAARDVIVAAEYTVLKVSQVVFAFREVAQRANTLQLVSDVNALHARMNVIDQKLLEVYRLSELYWSRKAPSAANSRNADSHMGITGIEDSNPRFTYDSVYNPIDSEDESTQTPPVPDVNSLINSLKDLTKQQLQCINQCWDDMIHTNTFNKARVEQLIWDTANNVTNLNQQIQVKDFKNKEVMNLVFQATVQHQICVDMLNLIRFGNDTASSYEDNNKYYALKVQTKELLERCMILLDQQKIDQTCVQTLTSKEKQHMKTLEQADRELVAMQQNRFRLPDHLTPWTTNVNDLIDAIPETLDPILKQCIAIRDSLRQQPRMPSPCLVAKLLDTITTLQQKTAIVKRTIPAQEDQEQVAESYQSQEDKIMNFVLSLTPLFDKYMNTPTTEEPDVPSTGNVLISQGLLEVSRIRNEQHRVAQQLSTYLFRFQVPSFETIFRILNKAADRCQVLKTQLVNEAPRVKNSMQGTTAVSAYSLYTLFYQALEEQLYLYDTLQQQLQLYEKTPNLPSFGAQVHDDKIEIGKLMKDISEWRMASQHTQGSQGSNEDDSFPFPVPTTFPPFNQPGQADQYAWSDSWGSEPEDPQPIDIKQDLQIIPDVINDIETQPVPPPSCKEILYTVNITYGQLDTYVGITVRARKSVDQLLWETAQFFPEKRDHCVARAIKQTIEGRQKLQACSKKVEQYLNSYNNIHLQMDSNLEDLPPVMQYAVDKAVQKLEFQYHDRTTTSDQQPFIEPGTVTAVCDVTELMDSMDAFILTDWETVTAVSIPLSSYLKAWFPFQNVVKQSQWATEQYSSYQEPAKCTVDQYNVRTNDGVVYQVPRVAVKVQDTSCRILLAADCSEDKSFALSLQQNAVGPAQVSALQILAEEHEIKLIPDYISDSVSVDGQVKDLTYDSPIVLFKDIAYGRKAVTVVVSRQKGGAIHVEYPLVGLDIIFDFSYISVEMSTVYKKQVCGLCGNFDGQVTRDLEGPAKQVFCAADDFFRSYIIPESQCPFETQPSAPEHHHYYGPVRPLPVSTSEIIDDEDENY